MSSEYVPFYESMSSAAAYYSKTKFETVDDAKSKIKLETVSGVKYDYDSDNNKYLYPVAAGDNMYLCHPINEDNAEYKATVNSSSATVQVDFSLPSTFSYNNLVNDLSAWKDYSYVYTSTTLQSVDDNAVVANVSHFNSACAIIRFNITNRTTSDIIITGIKMESDDGSKIYPDKLRFAFGAKTELSSVNVEFLGASITIKNLQQANKNSPMKNLFQADKIEIKFNLTQALRGKFDAENIELSGFAVNTERKTSGELPKKEKKQKEQKQKSENSFDFAEKKNEALNAAKNSIQEIFAEYNPQNIINELEGNLKSPETAKQVQAEAEALVSKWKNKPEELESQVKDLDQSVRSVLDTNWGNIDDVAKLKLAIENVTSAIEKSKSLTKNIQSTANDVKSDSKKTKKADTGEW